MDANSKVNRIYPVYTTKLNFYTKKIYLDVQKIDGSHLDTFGKIIADYLIKKKLERG